MTIMQGYRGFLIRIATLNFFSILAFLPLFGVSCTRSEPRISYGVIRLAYYQMEGGVEARYSLFVLPEDDDGIEDLDELYLYHDREGLEWRLASDDWVTQVSDGKTWVGSHSIAMVRGEALPRGQFRAVLIDKGGERSEKTFTFDAPGAPRFPFPSFTVAEGRYALESRYPANYLVCYDGEGTFVRTIPIASREGTLASLSLPDNVQGAALWAEDSERQTSALTGVVNLRD